METRYQYDNKVQFTALIHQDQDGVIDSYRYRYDSMGNKVGIEKQRRDLAEAWQL